MNRKELVIRGFTLMLLEQFPIPLVIASQTQTITEAE